MYLNAYMLQSSMHHVYLTIVLQDGDTILLILAREGCTTDVRCLLSTPGIDVNIKGKVSI